MLCLTYYIQVNELKAITAKKYKYISNIFIFLRGGPRGRVIPSSFPNLEVKPPIADNTYPVWIGNVGRCLFDFLLILSYSFPIFLKYAKILLIFILGFYSVKKNCICTNFRVKFTV